MTNAKSKPGTATGKLLQDVKGHVGGYKEFEFATYLCALMFALTLQASRGHSCMAGAKTKQQTVLEIPL